MDGDAAPTAVAERQAEILGDGPRLPPIASAAMTPAVEAIRQRMKSASGQSRIEIRDDNVPHAIGIMLHNPELYLLHTGVGLHLLGQGTLSARDRELAVLRVAWLCQAPYAWGEHVNIARTVGLSAEDVERITIGASAPGWAEEDRAILSAVEELLTGAMISDATWASLSARLDSAQLVELPTLVGQYLGVMFCQNSLRVPLQEGNVGLSAR
jgi:alkylhydroperoxidase family enzyme